MARFLDNAKGVEISFKPTDTSLSLENEKFDVVSTSDSVVNIWGHDYERFAGYKNFNNNNYINRRKYAKYFNNL